MLASRLCRALLALGCFATALSKEAVATGLESLREVGGADLASFLQQPYTVPKLRGHAVGHGTNAPHLIALRRESVPIYRRGKIASFKTSYSGTLTVGTPAQEFRVVFDTGSGHVVLPAAECKSEACLVHRRYNMSASETSVPINSDGSEVPEGELCDQVTIGFGTGQITGEFARDTVCFGSTAGADAGADANATGLVAKGDNTAGSPFCVEMQVVVAVEMSTQPFKTFHFDGILGLGLDGLALTRNFSAFDMLMSGGHLGSPRFGVFLTEGEEGEESEIALGGFNTGRTLEPLSWAPVAFPELGYWQIEIRAIRINGVTLDVCQDGTCRGVVDTGTSHWGVPAPFDAEVSELLTRSAGDLLDCRLVDAPEVEIELPSYNITLHPFNYMRRLPLREGVTVGSTQGVYVPSEETNATLQQPTAVVPAGDAVAVAGGTDGTEADIKRFCRPKIMPVRLPAPLGPKLFILGEPVLHRYYTVYDWASKQVGFSLANNRRNTMDPSELQGMRGELPKEVDMLLMQQRVGIMKEQVRRTTVELSEDVTAFVQVTVRVTMRRPRRVAV